AEVDLKQMVAISYADVKKVEKGYGELNSLGKRQNSPDSARRTQIVKDHVQKLGKGKDVTVLLLTGVEYYGAISKIEPDGFEIAEVDLKEMIAISYEDVDRVEKGYGKMNSSTGSRRKGLSSRPLWIFMAVGVASTIGFAIWASKRLGKRRSTGPFPVPFPQIP